MLDQFNNTRTAGLTLVNLLHQVEPSWATALKEASSVWASRTLNSTAETRIALEEEDSAYAVVLYRSPSRELADALRAGTPPADALVGWQDSAEALLDIHRKHWERLILVEIREEPWTLEPLVLHLSERLARDIPRPEQLYDSAGAGLGGNPPQDPLLDLVVLQLLNMRAPKALHEELEIASLPLGEKPTAMALIEDVYNAHLNSQDTLEQLGKQVDSQNAELSEVRKENSLVITQLHRAQEELERYLHTNRKLEQSIVGFRKGRDNRERKISALRRSREIQLTKAQQLRQALDENRKHVQQLNEKIANFRKGRESRERKIVALRNSREIHLNNSKELRAAYRALEANSQALEEELVQHQTRLQRRDEKLQRLRIANERQQKTLEELSKTNQKLSSELQQKRTEMKNIKNSRSWKYTKFLRQINKTES